MNLLPALGLGMLSGLRSMTGLAFLSDYALQHQDERNLPLHLLSLPQTASLLKVMAAGELIMDKTSFIPARTEAIPLIGRVLCGGLIGAAITRKEPLQGGLVGACAAIAGTYAAYYIRKALHDEVHIPNLILGIAEDAIVISASRAIVDDTLS